jgi:hypothetical protein
MRKDGTDIDTDTDVCHGSHVNSLVFVAELTDRIPWYPCA